MLQGRDIFLYKISVVTNFTSLTLVFSLSLMVMQTMGMAMMLDEIINYVQSLQHQVEVSDQKSKKEKDIIAFIYCQTKILIT